MARSQNGWPVLDAGSSELHRWIIPSRRGKFTLTLRHGSAGYVLAVFALWFSELVEVVVSPRLDDWGWSPLRNVRDGDTISNHCSGTAMDLNATAHGLGIVNTFDSTEVARIHDKLHKFHGVIRWGGDYVHRVDAMHWEVVQSLAVTERQARVLMRTPRGLRVLRANPGQRAVINS